MPNLAIFAIKAFHPTLAHVDASYAVHWPSAQPIQEPAHQCASDGVADASCAALGIARQARPDISSVIEMLQTHERT